MKDQVVNLVTYLQKVLEFYGDKKSYFQNQYLNDDISSLIDLDGGEQARQALLQVKDLLKQQDEMEKDFEKYLESMDEVPYNREELLEEIKKLKSSGDQNI